MEQNRAPEREYKLIQILIYFALTFLISWIFMVPWSKRLPQDRDIFQLIPAGYGPLLAAVLVIWISKGRSELRRWLVTIFRLRIPVILYLAGAFLLPFVIAGLHYGLYLILGGRPDFSLAKSWTDYPGELLGVALLLGGNEEPGWRGFALPALLERFHPLLAALVLGTIHSVWHLPLLGGYGTNLGWYLFNLIPLTIVLNWFYLKSRRSVIPVMLLHASTNVIGNFVPTPDVLLGGLGTSTVIRGLVYWIMAIVIVILTRGRLGADPTRSQPRE